MTFDDIQKKIITFFQNHEPTLEKLDDETHKLPLSDAVFCAEDLERNKKFRNGIHSAIQDLKNNSSNIIVVDAGAGTGILWIFALIFGATKCYFIEENPHTLKLCKQLVEHFWFTRQSIFLCDDASKIRLPEKYNLLISETITSGFVEEDFVNIVHHLKQFARTQTYIIPQSFELTITERPSWATQSFSFLSKKLPEQQEIILQSLNTNKIEFAMDAEIFDHIWLRSGQGLAFLNPREMDVNELHNFWEIKSTLN